MTTKSLSKPSLSYKEVITSGVKQRKRKVDKHHKVIPEEKFDFRQKVKEEEFKKHQEYIRMRNNKIKNLIKTKNSLLSVKVDIEDFKTKIDN